MQISDFNVFPCLLHFYLLCPLSPSLSKRLTAEQCLQHPWIKAHVATTANNTSSLDGSMNSLDSALCMDSASSMEPSPVSSASSSFSPAPSATSHSGGSGTVTSTTTTTTATTSAAVSGKVNELSQPEDMGKVNEKLGQIPKLATEQIIAETTEKPRPEGSPTSTASSTSTLRGEDVSEPVSTLESVASSAPEVTTTDGSNSETSSKPTPRLNPSSSSENRYQRTVSFECAQREKEKTPEPPSFKSATLGRERTSEKRTTSFERASEKRTTSFERASEKRTTSFERASEKQTTSFERASEKRTTSFERASEKRTTSFERASEKRTTSFERISSDKRTTSFERTPRETLSLKSSTLGRERSGADERRTVSFERKEKSIHLETPSLSVSAKTKSATLGRDRSPARTDTEGEQRRTISFERRDRSRSPQPPERDVTSLDPKTIESIERFNRLKQRSKARESESYIQPLAQSREKSKSPGPGSRRRSDGEKLTATQCRLSSKPLESRLPSSINESPRSSSSPESGATQKSSSAGQSTPAALTANATSRNSPSLSPNSKVEHKDCSVSPATQPPPQKTELKTQSENIDSEKKKEVEKNGEDRLEGQGEEKAKVEDVQPNKETEDERARKEREKAREERRKARKEEEKRKEEERKRQREEAERKMEEERKRMEQEREKARDVRRRERERKLAQRNNGSGSSESLIKTVDRSRWAWSVEARTSETTAQFNGVKPHPEGSDPTTDVQKEPTPETDKKDEVAPIRITPPQTSSPQPAKKERKTSATEFFQFGIDFSKKRPDNSTEARKTPSPPLRSKSPAKVDVPSTAVASKTPGVQTPRRSESPVVIVSPPPPTPEVAKENHETAAPVCHRRERSPVAEQQKRFKANKRMTPVISIDALDAILRGEVEDDPNALRYATEPNPYHHSQLESCPEENEPITSSSPRVKSPSPLLKETKSDPSVRSGHQILAHRREGVLPSALKDPNRSVSPEKRRVTLLTGKTQSVDFDSFLSPEPSDQSTSLTPSPSPDNFSKSFDTGRVHGVPKPEAISRLSVSGNYSSLSRSTPDLSDILGGGGRKGKEGRKVERSSSRRLGLGRSRMDSYVTSTEHSSSYYHSPASPHVMKSGRHATVTSRLLSGGKGFLSKWNESKNARQNHKVSS